MWFEKNLVNEVALIGGGGGGGGGGLELSLRKHIVESENRRPSESYTLLNFWNP